MALGDPAWFGAAGRPRTLRVRPIVVPRRLVPPVPIPFARPMRAGTHCAIALLPQDDASPIGLTLWYTRSRRATAVVRLSFVWFVRFPVWEHPSCYAER